MKHKREMGERKKEGQILHGKKKIPVSVHGFNKVVFNTKIFSKAA